MNEQVCSKRSQVLEKWLHATERDVRLALNAQAEGKTKVKSGGKCWDIGSFLLDSRLRIEYIKEQIAAAKANEEEHHEPTYGQILDSLTEEEFMKRAAIFAGIAEEPKPKRKKLSDEEMKAVMRRARAFVLGKTRTHLRKTPLTTLQKKALAEIKPLHHVKHYFS